MIAMSHNYPIRNALKVVNHLGEPVAGATIRVFDAVAYDAGVFDTWVGETTTDEDGFWHAPVFLPDAGAWVVHVQKSNTYGPSVTRIDT